MRIALAAISLAVLLGCDGSLNGRLGLSEIDVEDIDMMIVNHGNAPDVGVPTMEEIRGKEKEIHALLHLLVKAEPTSEHKCAGIFGLQFFLKDGSRISINLVPGHDPEYYEFRTVGGIYRLPRNDFIAAVTALGIKEEALSDEWKGHYPDLDEIGTASDETATGDATSNN